MKSRIPQLMSLIALLMAAIVAGAAAPASAQVHDNAKIFSADAVTKADDAMAAMKAKHNKEFVLVTFAAVPADQQADLQQGKSAFFNKWMQDQAAANKVNGVIALICMNPKYVEVGAGANTRARSDFTENDITRLREQLQSDFHGGQFDQGLSNATDLVERAYAANIGGNEPAGPGRAAAAPVYPSYPNASPMSHSGGFGLGLGSLLCLGVGALLIVSLIHSVFSRGRGFGGGGYGGSYGGGPNYPMGGGGFVGPGYGGGGGGGFGSGLLGGLLGGAVGGYAADKFEHRNDGGGSSGGSGSFPEPSGGGGGGFDSGPSDAGQGFGGGSSGGDFGGGGGGGDSGGGF